MSSHEERGKDNAAIRGYVLRLLAKGHHFSFLVRRLSGKLMENGLIGEEDIWEPLKYLHDMQLIEFVDKRVTPYTAYERDAVVRLTTKGVRFIESGGDDETGIDL